MVDINKAKLEFKNFMQKYSEEDRLSFNLKVIHTYHVAENAREIATKLNLSEEDINLAELIGLLHDIGRFDELKFTGGMDNGSFNHGIHGAKILFEEGLIRSFVEDNKYDDIIKKSIENHNKLFIEDGLTDKELLHVKLIRDADKLDNYRVKKEEKVEAIFPGQVNSAEEMENSKISDKVYQTILDKKLVDIRDRKYPLDYWLCILAFAFDMNFSSTFKMMKENDYINVVIDRFDYKDKDTKNKIEIIRKLMNDFVDAKSNNENKGI